MAVYIKKVATTSPNFQNREIVITSSGETERIPVPDSVVLCGGCNRNQSGDTYMVYLGKRELAKGQAYDCYCAGCVKRYFPSAKEA